MTTTVEKKLNALFEELVPASGKADTVAGEIVRAITRIGYRNWNDGDHIGVGYGKETCNPAARYLSAKCGEAVNAAIDAISFLPESEDKEFMIALARYSIDREV